MFATQHTDLRQLVGSLRTTGDSPSAKPAGTKTRPFITISRQAGAGGRTLAMTLARRLNERPGNDHPWQFLDRELVEKIAADHHLSEDLILSLERSSHTWIEELLGGLSLADKPRPSDLTVFKRVAETIRALAQAGHVVLVGLGGAFMTRDMPGGLHVRLVAPFAWRVDHLARTDRLSIDHARDKVRLLDRNRDAFYAAYWPGLSLAADAFHVTFNASLLAEEQMADALAALLAEPTA